MKQLETDIAVVGGGAAGLAAAIVSAEGGASVILLEKRGRTGGFGAGPFAVESSLQFKKLYSLTREEAFKIHMDYTHWRVDAHLVKTYYDKSASTIDWLEKMGIEWVEINSHNAGYYYTWHIPRETPGTADPTTLWPVMNRRAKELGVQYYCKTPAKKLLKEDNRITGVLAQDEPGEEIQVKAKAVIIATGGFGDNPEWIKKYTGYTWNKDLFSMRIPGLVGDGIRMAWDVGAAQGNMTMHITYGLPGIPGSSRILGAILHQPNFIVNLLGERFMNEEVMGNNTYAGNAIAIQKNSCAFNIIDEDTKQVYIETGLDFPGGPRNPNKKIEDFDVEIEKVIDRGSESIFIANSLEELADRTGINKNNLLKTVTEYNIACETGRDNLFDKKARYLRPVKQPRFYAFKNVPSAYGSLGGIKINYKTEVLNKDFKAIPGLYAAGIDANSIYGDSYIFILPGNTMGFAFNTGRIAGENALEYIKSLVR
jgi:fumarate reductase flavoprotein subunit